MKISRDIWKYFQVIHVSLLDIYPSNFGFTLTYFQATLNSRNWKIIQNASTLVDTHS